ncbi:hypothetical protein D5085_14460 [Ectothiorhodospiraceae bacterium BW-2]|nr:hypothetical protein D5085_14460 [Ectothiorhodospiraceae bacterium BW-2]
MSATVIEQTASLPPSIQRQLAATLIIPYRNFCEDSRLEQILAVMQGGGGDNELQAVRQLAQSLVVDRHTRCGAEGDWQEQAGYFIARAAAAAIAVTPKGGAIPKVVQNCRMAASCAALAHGEESDISSEQITEIEQFLAQQKGEQP